MARLIHRAALINGHGSVSALCFKEPRAISLGRASWTNRDGAVTCKKCLEAIAARSQVQHKAPQEDHGNG